MCKVYVYAYTKWPASESEGGVYRGIGGDCGGGGGGSGGDGGGGVVEREREVSGLCQRPYVAVPSDDRGL